MNVRLESNLWSSSLTSLAVHSLGALLILGAFRGIPQILRPAPPGGHTIEVELSALNPGRPPIRFPSPPLRAAQSRQTSTPAVSSTEGRAETSADESSRIGNPADAKAGFLSALRQTLLQRIGTLPPQETATQVRLILQLELRSFADGRLELKQASFPSDSRGAQSESDQKHILQRLTEPPLTLPALPEALRIKQPDQGESRIIRISLPLTAMSPPQA